MEQFKKELPKEQGDKKPHEASVIQEITIETVEEVEAMKKSNTDM